MDGNFDVRSNALLHARFSPMIVPKILQALLILAIAGFTTYEGFSKNDCTARRCLLKKEKMKFMLLGDWGGLPVWPFFSPAQIQVAVAMGEVGYNESTDFQISMGDNFYMVGVQNEYDDRFSATFERIYTHPILRRTPWYILAGNHDHNGNTTAQLVYSRKSIRWTFPRLFYIIRYQLADGTKIDIMIIDTVILCGQTRDGKFDGIVNYLLASSSKPKSPKNRRRAEKRWQWIEYHLNKSSADYIFIAGHYPVYSTADHGPTPCLVNRLNPLMERYKVSAYLSGHDHNLQHLQVRKQDATVLNYVVSGAGAFTDVSTANLDKVPTNSCLFHYPRSSWFNLLNNAGLLTNGGFVLAELDRFSTNFTYINGRKERLYSFSAYPRTVANGTTSFEL